MTQRSRDGVRESEATLVTNELVKPESLNGRTRVTGWYGPEGTGDESRQGKPVTEKPSGRQIERRNARIDGRQAKVTSPNLTDYASLKNPDDAVATAREAKAPR